MTPTAVIRQATAEGVTLSLSPAGTIKVTGNVETVNRWLPVLRKNKPGIVVALATNPALFDFAPPADPVSDREAIEERAGIIAEACGIDLARALQEAHWQAEREWAWRAFLRNAQRILEAPERARMELLDCYRMEAASRYGQTVAKSMARAMAGWIAARET